MLALTAAPLQTAGERAVFAELSGWDRGPKLRPGVLVSLPMTDGPMARRTCDAVLFVPEGVAVVRIVEAPQQRGMVTVVPEGAWSIAPTAGPGEVLQLLGGGSSPLDGLMRAGMDTAVRLRRAGIEPGRIARLTILVGELTGLVPADGDLGGGDHVALVDRESLVLGIARSASYAGVDNPRLWTTADVRAALTALEMPGRGPSIEELNSEGFPYSPYVLRKPELLTPASVTAASVAAPPRVPSVRPDPAAPAGPSPTGPAVAPAAFAAPTGAAFAATGPAFAPAAATQEPRRGEGQTPMAAPTATATIEQSDTDSDTGNGVGGLFSAEESTEPGRWQQPRTRIASAESPRDRVPASLVVARRRPDRARRLRLLAAAAVLLVAVVITGVVLAVRGNDSDAGAQDDPSPTSAPSTPQAGPSVGDTTTVGGVTFTLQRLESGDSCVGHAHDQVADFFAATDCTGLVRALFSADIGGQGAVVAVSHVAMPDTQSARALKDLVDTDGTGNVSDLLDEGVRYPSGPSTLSDAQYASAPPAAGVVTIVETSWVDPDLPADPAADADLDALADTALDLELPAPTA